MKLHRNAKSTPSSRLLLVRRVLFEGWSYPAAAEGAGVSERTVAKWVRRFRAGRRRRARGRARPGPGAPAHQTPPWAVTLIQWLREQHGLPAWAIGHALRIPRSTVTAWLRRLGLNRPAVGAGRADPAVRMAAAGRHDSRRYQTVGPNRLRRASDPRRSATRESRRRLGVRPRRRRRPQPRRVCRGAGGPARADVRGVSDPGRRVVSRARDPSCGASSATTAAGTCPRRFRAACATRWPSAIGGRGRTRRAPTARPNASFRRCCGNGPMRCAYATSVERRRALRPFLAYYNRRRPHASLKYEPPWSRLQSAA